LIPLPSNTSLNDKRVDSIAFNSLHEERFTWDRVLQFSFPGQVLAELKFWNENIKKLNSKKLMNYSISSVLIYSDASSIGAAAYSVELENKVFHRMWEIHLKPN
jgi:hypothetical protein